MAQDSTTKKTNKRGAKSTVSHIKSGQFRPEVKQYDTGLNLTSLDTNPSSSAPALYQVTTFNNIASGDGQSERTGIKIQAKRLQLRVKTAVDPNSDSSNANIVADAHTFRIVVFLDKFKNGQTVTFDDIFDYVPTDAGQLYDYPNKFQERRFKLLVDKIFTVEPSYVTFDGHDFHAYGNNCFHEFDIPLSHDIWYGDTSNNLSAIYEGNIGMFVCADVSSANIGKIKFSYRSRLSFVDY